MIVVVPLAGRGKRFSDGGVDTPKPFITVGGRTILDWALDSLDGLAYSTIVFVALAEHAGRYPVRQMCEARATGRLELIELPAVTEGQLCTVLAARRFLQSDEDLLIASADTFVQSNLSAAVAHRRSDCRGLISVGRLAGDYWSFVAVDAESRATRVAEKERISPWASTGLYHFSSAGEFTLAADALVASGARTRGEFYVMPVYQRYIDDGKRIEITEAAAVWDMGTPDALRAFEAHVIRE